MALKALLVAVPCANWWNKVDSFAQLMTISIAEFEVSVAVFCKLLTAA